MKIAEVIILIVFGALKLWSPKVFRIYYFYEFFDKSYKPSGLELMVERLFGLGILVYGIYLATGMF